MVYEVYVEAAHSLVSFIKYVCTHKIDYSLLETYIFDHQYPPKWGEIVSEGLLQIFMLLRFHKRSIKAFAI